MKRSNVLQLVRASSAVLSSLSRASSIVLDRSANSSPPSRPTRTEVSPSRPMRRTLFRSVSSLLTTARSNSPTVTRTKRTPVETSIRRAVSVFLRPARKRSLAMVNPRARGLPARSVSSRRATSVSGESLQSRRAPEPHAAISDAPGAGSPASRETSMPGPKLRSSRKSSSTSLASRRVPARGPTPPFLSTGELAISQVEPPAASRPDSTPSPDSRSVTRPDSITSARLAGKERCIPLDGSYEEENTSTPAVSRRRMPSTPCSENIAPLMFARTKDGLRVLMNAHVSSRTAMSKAEEERAVSLPETRLASHSA